MGDVQEEGVPPLVQGRGYGRDGVPRGGQERSRPHHRVPGQARRCPRRGRRGGVNSPIEVPSRTTPEAPTGWEDFFCCAPGQTQAPCNKGHVEMCVSAGPPNLQVAVVLHKETSQQPAAGTRVLVTWRHITPPLLKKSRGARPELLPLQRNPSRGDDPVCIQCIGVASF